MLGSGLLFVFVQAERAGIHSKVVIKDSLLVDEVVGRFGFLKPW